MPAGIQTAGGEAVRRDRKVYAALAVIFLCAAALVLAAGSKQPEILPDTRTVIEQRTETTADMLDLNRATEAQLDALPGVGPVLAARIISYRERYGGFASVEELLLVRGIGDGMLAKLRPYLCIEAPDGA